MSRLVVVDPLPLKSALALFVLFLFCLLEMPCGRMQVLLENAAKANALDGQGIKGEIDKWYEMKIQPIKDVLAETEENELQQFIRRLLGQKPESKYLDYVTKVAEAGPKGYLSGGDALKKETELEMELRRMQHHQHQGGFAPLVLRLLRPWRDRGGPARCRLHVVWMLCKLAQRPL